MKLLSDAVHSVELITTQIAPGERLPSCMPSGIPVHEVLGARRRQAGQSRVRPIRLIAKLRQLIKIVARQRYDVIHFYGSFRFADFAALAPLTGVKTAPVVTVNDSEIPSRFWSIRRRFCKR